MATSRRHTTAKPLAGGNSVPLSTNGQVMTIEERKLLQWVRTYSSQIVAGLTRTAADAGNNSDFAQMNQYLQIANTGSVLLGQQGEIAMSGTGPPNRRITAAPTEVAEPINA